MWSSKQKLLPDEAAINTGGAPTKTAAPRPIQLSYGDLCADLFTSFLLVKFQVAAQIGLPEA